MRVNSLRLVAPAALMPTTPLSQRAECFTQLQKGIQDADVIIIAMYSPRWMLMALQRYARR